MLSLPVHCWFTLRISIIYLSLTIIFWSTSWPLCIFASEWVAVSFRPSSSCPWVLSKCFVTDGLQRAGPFRQTPAAASQFRVVFLCLQKQSVHLAIQLYDWGSFSHGVFIYLPSPYLWTTESNVSSLPSSRAKAQNAVAVYFRLTLLIHSYLNPGRNICGSTSTDSTFSCWTMSFIRAGKLMWAILWRIGGYQLWSASQRGYATW